MKRILALLLCLLLLLASAQAELKRNSRGDEVEQLQQMLTDLGFLNDKIDGIFGRKTEAAVKAVQDYFGEKQTGIYDDALDMKLLDLWGTVMGIMDPAVGAVMKEKVCTTAGGTWNKPTFLLIQAGMHRKSSSD